MRRAPAPLALTLAALLSAAPVCAEDGPPDPDVGGASYSLGLAAFAASLFGGSSEAEETVAKAPQAAPSLATHSDGQAVTVQNGVRSPIGQDAVSRNFSQQATAPRVETDNAAPLSEAVASTSKDEQTSSGSSIIEEIAQVIQRGRPGAPPQQEVPEAKPLPGAIRHRADPVPYSRRTTNEDFAPIPDRWRLINALPIIAQPDGPPVKSPENLFDPYNRNILKGDRPVFDDWFVNLLAISDTIFEPRTVPTPVGIQSSQRSNSVDLFGDADQWVFNQNLILSFQVIKGNTAYKPPDYEFRFTPVINYNRAEVEELRVLEADPRRGFDRSDKHIGVQELFLDIHLQNVSDRYDFDSVRFGIQPFSTDFRGFLFQDNQLGVRLFGTRDNNIFQYNLAWFRRMEKDTNSGLNHIDRKLREDDIFIANLFWQDFPVLGFQSQVIGVYNRNREADDFFFNENDFIERPSSFAAERGRNYDVGYIGFNGDGHFGRLNLMTSLYHAFGSDRDNTFTGETGNIQAWFFAAEPSIDFDWIRLRGSMVYASGDKDPFDDEETGFDAIFENPQIAGSDTNYWIRQAVPLIGGGGVVLSNRNAMLPALRGSKEHGQSNFNNPGFRLLGVGTDLDILPELRLSTNLNYMEFDDTTVLEVARNQGNINREIGYDVSAALIWRPLFTQNIVFRLSGAALFAGEGFQDLYGEQEGDDDVYYSVLANLVLTY